MGPKCQKLARKSLLMQKASIFLLPSTFHNCNNWTRVFPTSFFFCWLCSKSTRKFMKATLIRVGHYTFQGIRAAQQQQFSQQSHQPYFWSQLQFQAFSILNEKRDTVHTHSFGKFSLIFSGTLVALPAFWWFWCLKNCGPFECNSSFGPV